MKLKKVLCGVLCGVLIAGTSSVALVEAATTDSVSGRCGNTGVVGSANIARHSASAYTTQSGNSGSVTVDSSCKYRDVSAGKTRSLTRKKTATVSASTSFTVYEEDYMKTLNSTHSASLGNYTWSGNTTSVSY